MCIDKALGNTSKINRSLSLSLSLSLTKTKAVHVGVFWLATVSDAEGRKEGRKEGKEGKEGREGRTERSLSSQGRWRKKRIIIVTILNVLETH